jgi:heat shock protein HslJ/membrane-bound inhibitor of C-type lysozyme
MVKLFTVWTVTLVMAGCAQMSAPERPKSDAPSDALELVGTTWLLEDLSGRGVTDRVQATLEFVAADRIAGRGGCNRYTGRAVVAANTVRFGPLAATKMACPPAIMEQEHRFFAALEASATYRIDEQRKLLLSDESAAVQLRFSRLDARSQDTQPGGAGTEAARGRAATLNAHVYACPDGASVETRNVRGSDAIDATLGGTATRLPRVRAGSGAKYSDGALTVWNKGTEILVERNGTRQTCTENRTQSIAADARLRGVEFRALGNEPGWLLEIFGDRIDFAYDYGQAKVTTPRPPVKSAGRAVTEYHAITEAYDLRVRITERACCDVMSGEAFSARVDIVLNGKGYSGCGGSLC